MSNPLLTVGTDIVGHRQYSAVWAKYGFRATRVDSMYDAIRCVAHGGESFSFVIIDADTARNFQVELPFLRDTVKVPIFVVTSDYTTEKRIEALRCGADAYELYQDSVEHNVLTILELLKATNRWAEYKATQLSVLVGGGIILSVDGRTVIINNNEASLTKKEFDVLHYLMTKSSYVLTYKQILQRVWSKEYNENDNYILWCTIDRLRQKLSKMGASGKLIKVERGVGYRFLP